MGRMYIKYFICYMVGLFFLIMGLINLANHIYLILSSVSVYKVIYKSGWWFETLLIKISPNLLSLIIAILLLIISNRVSKSIISDNSDNQFLDIGLLKKVGKLSAGVLIIISSVFNVFNPICNVFDSYMGLRNNSIGSDMFSVELNKIFLNTILLDLPSWIIYFIGLLIGVVLLKRNLNELRYLD